MNLLNIQAATTWGVIHYFKEISEIQKTPDGWSGVFLEGKTMKKFFIGFSYGYKHIIPNLHDFYFVISRSFIDTLVYNW